MTFPAPQSLRNVNPQDSPVAFGYASWVDSQYVLDHDIIMPNVYGNHLPDSTSLFALDCNEFWPPMCALKTEFRVPRHSQRPARGRFVHAYRVHWEALGSRISLSKAAELNLLFARSDDEYTYCR